MGKTVKSIIKKPVSGTYKFSVLVRVHGKAHTEIYEIKENDYNKAKDLGYFDEHGKNEVYYDWKPSIGSGKSVVGGVKEVEAYSFDEKYAYAHVTSGETYSLPKYLFDKIGEKKNILVGRRVK